MQAELFINSIEIDYRLKVVKRGEKWFLSLIDNSSSLMLDDANGAAETEDGAVTAAKYAVAKALRQKSERLADQIENNVNLVWE